jgi:hypothetical protein
MAVVSCGQAEEGFSSGGGKLPPMYFLIGRKWDIFYHPALPIVNHVVENTRENRFQAIVN